MLEHAVVPNRGVEQKQRRVDTPARRPRQSGLFGRMRGVGKMDAGRWRNDVDYVDGLHRDEPLLVDMAHTADLPAGLHVMDHLSLGILVEPRSEGGHQRLVVLLLAMEARLMDTGWLRPSLAPFDVFVPAARPLGARPDTE